MQLGMGTIRLRGLATISTSAAGHHQLEYRNAHRPDASVYLVNVLVPSDRRIQIGPQRRDAAQHWLRVEYDVGSETLERDLLQLVDELCAKGLTLASPR